MSSTLAVISQTGESLSFFDLTSGERTTHLTNVTAEPHELCLDPKRNVLYMTHAYRHGNYWQHGDNAHDISVVDLTTRQVVDVIDTRPAKGPHGLYINTDQDVLYVSVEELPDVEVGGGVIGIDLKTKKTIKTAPSAYTSHWFVMTPDSKKAYTCNKTASFISVLDLEGGTMRARIELDGGHEEPGISPDGRRAYFPTPGLMTKSTAGLEPRIVIIDTLTDAIVDEIRTDGLRTIPVHVTSRGQILAGQYTDGDKDTEGVERRGSARLAVYDSNSLKLIGSVPCGLLPLTIRSSPDGKLAFVAGTMVGTVDVVDLDEMKVLRTLTVDTQRRADKYMHCGAHGLAYIPS